MFDNFLFLREKLFVLVPIAAKVSCKIERWFNNEMEKSFRIVIDPIQRVF